MDETQREEIARLTEEYGGAWGVCHTRRLLHLIEIIGAGLDYDRDVVWLAAHLHDWGGYAPWAQEGVDHAVRSRQVAEAYLAEHGFPQATSGRVLDCVAFHHQAGADRPIEALLLRDADALDFLGVVGVLRDFSKNPKDMRKACETARKRREKLPGILCLEKSRSLAAERVAQMDELLASFERDTWGNF